MRLKRRNRASRPVRGSNSTLGFSNEKLIELLSTLTGFSPVGELGRDTPLDLSSLEAARSSLLFRELYSKYDDGTPSKSKSETTWKRFHDAESECQKTNLRFFETAYRDPFWINVRRRIWTVLGKFEWDEAARHFGHGPGGTTRLTKASAFAAYKYSGIPESTSGNAVLATCAIAHVPLWKQSVQISAEAKGTTDILVIVPGNSVIAVPKNYKTDRTIAKEPCMNVYIQKGIGRCIRKRLNRVGVDLDDQTKNQRAALHGSVSGELATVDLSMASDTLSYEVVSWLLPNDWWYALEQCRSPVGVLPSGESIRYQKFSSMGNGYTFELESLIFWAICQQTCKPNVNEREMSVCVYGDDLIVPSIHFEALCERLQQAGFTPNAKKSFSTGPFRESCGKQYYLGADITPFYVRRPVKHLDRLFLVTNNVYRWCERVGIDGAEVVAKLRRLAPASWRIPRLPDGFGDGAFIGAIDELRLDSHPHGWEYWQVSALARTSIELEGDLPFGQLIASIEASTRRDYVVSEQPFLEIGSACNRVLPGYRERFEITEATSGLPARAGRFKEIKILIPRHPHWQIERIGASP